MLPRVLTGVLAWILTRVQTGLLTWGLTGVSAGLRSVIRILRRLTLPGVVISGIVWGSTGIFGPAPRILRVVTGVFRHLPAPGPLPRKLSPCGEVHPHAPPIWTKKKPYARRG